MGICITAGKTNYTHKIAWEKNITFEGDENKELRTD
jgi:hypothetical protein